MAPQVDTVDQAKHVISAAKFGAKKKGSRSAPPFRLMPGLTDTPIDPAKTIHENLNDQAAIIIQIETLEAINNLDAILTEVPEVDGCWLGTLDCRVSMGLPGNGGMGGTETEWTEAVAKYESVMKKHDKPRTGFALGPNAAKMGEGKSYIVCAADVAALGGMAAELHKNREIFPSPPASKQHAQTSGNWLSNGSS